jgi:replicative DNA helicase
LLVSLEMSRLDIQLKALSFSSHVPTANIYDGKIDGAKDRLQKAIEEWKNPEGDLLKVMDVAQSGRTKVGRILSEMKKLYRTFKPKVVIFDYLSLMGADIPNANRPDLDLSNICKTLRGEGRKNKFAVIILCQLKREAIERMKKILGSKKGGGGNMGGEDLGGSQEIANDSDAIFFLMLDQDDTKLRVSIGKNRFGPKADFKLSIKKEEGWVGTLQDAVKGQETTVTDEMLRVDPVKEKSILDKLKDSEVQSFFTPAK